LSTSAIVIIIVMGPGPGFKRRAGSMLLVVGWMLAPHERAEVAERLIAETCAKHGIQPGHLTRHADRGGAMRSKPVARLLADLGVTKTHSRPHGLERQIPFQSPVQDAQVLCAGGNGFSGEKRFGATRAPCERLELLLVSLSIRTEGVVVIWLVYSEMYTP
jgi:hypothetical protein